MHDGGKRAFELAAPHPGVCARRQSGTPQNQGGRAAVAPILIRLCGTSPGRPPLEACSPCRPSCRIPVPRCRQCACTATHGPLGCMHALHTAPSFNKRATEPLASTSSPRPCHLPRAPPLAAQTAQPCPRHHGLGSAPQHDEEDGNEHSRQPAPHAGRVCVRAEGRLDKVGMRRAPPGADARSAAVPAAAQTSDTVLNAASGYLWLLTGRGARLHPPAPQRHGTVCVCRHRRCRLLQVRGTLDATCSNCCSPT